jgi:hypothetical protein
MNQLRSIATLNPNSLNSGMRLVNTFDTSQRLPSGFIEDDMRFPALICNSKRKDTPRKAG